MSENNENEIIRSVSSFPIFSIIAEVVEKRDTGKSIIIGPSADNMNHTGFIPDKPGVKYSHENWSIVVGVGPREKGARWDSLVVGKTYKFYLSAVMDRNGYFGASVKFWYHNHE